MRYEIIDKATGLPASSSYIVAQGGQIYHWIRLKSELGWVQGQCKDAATLEHLGKVPYAQLNPVHKAKILIFSRLVGAMS